MKNLIKSILLILIANCSGLLPLNGQSSGSSNIMMPSLSEAQAVDLKEEVPVDADYIISANFRLIIPVGVSIEKIIQNKYTAGIEAFYLTYFIKSVGVYGNYYFKEMTQGKLNPYAGVKLKHNRFGPEDDVFKTTVLAFPIGLTHFAPSGFTCSFDFGPTISDARSVWDEEFSGWDDTSTNDLKFGARGNFKIGYRF